MSITSAEQMSMNPVLAADSSGASAASVVMPGGIGVSSSSVRPRAGVRDHGEKVRAGRGWAEVPAGLPAAQSLMRHDIRAAPFPPGPHGVSPQ
ncbi:hypothetical protein GCM10010327_09320 [Streptomyces nitrosporeus]|nr:hypothetical protein GCM10010327_09320 [Streptomyces nitrosporeus]